MGRANACIEPHVQQITRQSLLSAWSDRILAVVPGLGSSATFLLARGPYAGVYKVTWKPECQPKNKACGLCTHVAAHEIVYDVHRHLVTAHYAQFREGQGGAVHTLYLPLSLSHVSI